MPGVPVGLLTLHAGSNLPVPETAEQCANMLANDLPVTERAGQWANAELHHIQPLRVDRPRSFLIPKDGGFKYIIWFQQGGSASTQLCVTPHDCMQVPVRAAYRKGVRPPCCTESPLL